MNLGRRASDWEAAGLCQIGGAAVGGGGVYQFSFRSQRAGGQTTALFVGGGIGAGGGVGGGTLPSFEDGSIPYGALDCEREFSMWDLHNSFGRLSSAGVALAVGIGATYISASTRQGLLFGCEGGIGGISGVGASAVSFVGVWRVEALVGAMDRAEREMIRDTNERNVR